MTSQTHSPPPPHAPRPASTAFSWLRSKWTWAVVALALGALLIQLTPILFPFITSFLLAYILYPIHQYFCLLAQRRQWTWLKPSIAALLVISAFGLLCLALVLLLIPMLITEIPFLIEKIPSLGARALSALTPLSQSLGFELPPLDQLLKLVRQGLMNYSQIIAKHLLQSILIGGSGALTLLGNALLIPICTYYVLIGWDTMLHQVQQAIPHAWRPAVLSFLMRIHTLIGGYFHGQMILMLFLSAYYSIGLWLLDIPWAFSIGTFTGLAIAIPYVGFALGALLAITMSLVHWESWTIFCSVLTLYTVGQILESLYLTPKWVGEKIGLHPVMVIFLLMAFGQLLGFIGILLALPLGAILMVLAQLTFEQYRHSELFDPPESEHKTSSPPPPPSGNTPTHSP